MIKKTFLFLGSLFIILILVLVYLSTFGVETDKFNKRISEKVKATFPELDLKLDKLKLILDPFNFKINVVTHNPQIKIKSKSLKLKKVSSNYNIISFFKKKFGIRNLIFETEYNNLNDVLKLARSIKDSPQLLILDKMSNNGKLYVNAEININENGQIKENYQISGELKNLSIKLLNNENIDDISFKFNHSKNKSNLTDVSFKFQDLSILSNEIEIKKNKKVYAVKGDINSPLSGIDDKITQKYLNIPSLKNIIFASNSNFSFDIGKRFKFKNFYIKSNINLKNAIYSINNKNLEKFIPKFKNTIQIQNNQINLEYKKNLTISGGGDLSISKEKEIIKYNIKKSKNDFEVNFNVSLNKTPIKFYLLNFYKDEKSNGKLSVNFKKNNDKISLDNLSFISNNDKFFIKKLDLSNEYNLIDFAKLKFNYKDKNKIKNDLVITRKKNHYLIEGNNFSLSNIIENILTGSNSNKTKLFRNKPRNFKIKFNENNIDKDHIIYDLQGEITVNKSEIDKLNLKSKFYDGKEIFLSISNKDNQKITTFYSDLAKPFVKKFKFIKGFEEGKINYSSKKINNISNSYLNIYDFKLKQLPALTKLLTLASLQGISDILTGEGVRFDEFEMIFSNENKLMKIDEIYSIGPAISIMMDGYIQNDELVSLKGTLVPATTINKFVSSIPILGEILVGKKTGEGVFGVSFKIKGHPDNLKTTVNPIKTLTPRFITRTLEKIKKTNQ